MLEDVVITCTVTYKDGSTESVDVSVGNKIMTYVEAGVSDDEAPKCYYMGRGKYLLRKQNN